MKPAPFDYHRPDSIAEALALLAANRGRARVLAGGQTLVPALNQRLDRPSVLVDINRIPDLDRIELADDMVRVGPLVRQQSLLDALGSGGTAGLSLPLVAAALPGVGHIQTRNRGTVVGSIAARDPLAQLPLVALVGGASITIGRTGSEPRIEEIDDFLDAVGDAEPHDGLVLSVDFVRASPDSATAYEEFRHNVLLGAAAVNLDGGIGRVGFLTGVGRPVLHELDTRQLTEQRSEHSGGQLRDAASSIVESAQFLDDVHAAADYRCALTIELLSRALGSAMNAVSGDHKA